MILNTDTWKIPKEDLEKAKRLDPKFFHPEKQEAIEKILKHGEKLAKVVLPNGIFRGNGPYKPEYVKQGIPVLNTNNMTENGIDWGNVSYIPEALYNKLKKRRILMNDVLLASTGIGSIGKVAIVGFIPREFDRGVLVTPKLTVVRCNESKMNPFFLAMFLMSSPGQKQIHGLTRGGTGQIELYPSDVGEIAVLLSLGSAHDQAASKLREVEELRETLYYSERELRKTMTEINLPE